MSFYSCSFLFYFDRLSKLSTNKEDEGNIRYLLLLKLLLCFLSNYFQETILIISAKVTYFCKGDFLTSKKVFGNMESAFKNSSLYQGGENCAIYILKRELDPQGCHLCFFTSLILLPLGELLFICTHVNEENNHM